MKKDPRIDAYIEKSADFAKPILKYIRKQIHKGCPEVEETWKWSFPNFMYNGEILCNMAAFKGHCSFGFWKGSLIPELNKVINEKGETAMGQFGRLSSVDDLPNEKSFATLIKKAMKLSDEGAKVPSRIRSDKPKKLVVPKYLKDALQKNKKALAAFEAFPYSHKKEYVEWITEAKTDETRNKRLKTAMEWMAEGKDRNWKYK